MEENGKFSREDFAPEMDAKIRAAMEVNIPEHIILRDPWDATVTDLSEARDRAASAESPVWLRPLALAASLVAAVTLAAALWPAPGNSPLAEEVLAHLAHEPDAMVVSKEAVPEDLLAAVLSPRVEVALTDLGLVTYVRDCGFQGENVPHLVIQGEAGPVMLLFMKNIKLDRVVPVRGEGYRGIVMPLGEGSIAIVGTDAEPVNRIRERMDRTVRWRI